MLLYDLVFSCPQEKKGTKFRSSYEGKVNTVGPSMGQAHRENRRKYVTQGQNVTIRGWGA
jgi:hypothetical protein